MGTLHADEITVAFWQRFCFERSYLTHKKQSSTPAGKEREKVVPCSVSHCTVLPVQDVSLPYSEGARVRVRVHLTLPCYP